MDERMADLEGTVAQIYLAAGADPDMAERPSDLAEWLFGEENVGVGDCGKARGAIFEGVAGWIVMVSPRVRPENRQWVIGHELAHWARQTSCATSSRAEERACDYVGAALQMPRRPFLAALAELGRDYQALGARFGATAESAALRVGELTGEGLLMSTPAGIYARGDVDVDRDTAARLVRDGGPGLIRVVLGRKRVVVRAG